jgi:hypothetical protein
MATSTESVDAPSAPPLSPEERVEKLVEVRLNERGSRRTFLKMLGVGAGVAAATTGCGSSAPTTEEFFRQHYRKLTDEDKKRIFARIEEETFARTGVHTKVGDPPPIDGVEFAYALNLSVCNGSRRCVEACARENNLPDDPEIRYIRVMEMEAGSLDFEDATPNYESEKVPAKGKFYLPVQCHQCDNPPCVKARIRGISPIARASKASSRSAPSASTAREKGASQPASRRARRARASSETSMIRIAR